MDEVISVFLVQTPHAYNQTAIIGSTLPTHYCRPSRVFVGAVGYPVCAWLGEILSRCHVSQRTVPFRSPQSSRGCVESCIAVQHYFCESPTSIYQTNGTHFSLYAYSLDDTQIQKGIYYSLVTTTDFEPSSDATYDEHTISSKKTTLTPTDVARCRNLMNGIVEHFTPVLFEPVSPTLLIASVFDPCLSPPWLLWLRMVGGVVLHGTWATSSHVIFMIQAQYR